MAQVISHQATTSKRRQATTHKAFSEHINELRSRVMWVVFVFIVTSSVAYNYRDFLVHLVLSPLGNQKLVYLTPAGGFSFIFQITMYAGAVITAPLLIYHLYKFVVPALPAHARRHSLLVILSAVVLMCGGVSFGYFVAVPAALHFLTTFAGSYVEANLTADSYLSFILAYVAGLGVLFQLPLLLVFWNWMTPLGPGKLLSTERYIVVFAFIAAAVMTPTPDVLNQSMIALPIIGIYQLGVFAVLITNRASKRHANKAAKTTPVMRRGTAPELPHPTLFEAIVSVEPQIVPEPFDEPEEERSTPSKPKVVQRTSTANSAPRRIRTIDGVVRPQGPMRQVHHVIAPQRTLPPRGAVRPVTRAVSIDGFL